MNETPVPPPPTDGVHAKLVETVNAVTADMVLPMYRNNAKIIEARFPKPTAAELYAKVRRAAKRIPVAINVLRQIDAGQKMRHREVRFRDEALTFLANNFSPDTATAETIKEAMSIVETTTRKLRTLPNGDRRTRRLASRELDRAIRRSQRPAKTEYNLAT